MTLQFQSSNTLKKENNRVLNNALVHPHFCKRFLSLAERFLRISEKYSTFKIKPYAQACSNKLQTTNFNNFLSSYTSAGKVVSYTNNRSDFYHRGLYTVSFFSGIYQLIPIQQVKPIFQKRIYPPKFLIKRR